MLFSIFALTALFICLKTLSCCLGHMKIFIGTCFLAILVFVKKQAFETQDFVRKTDRTILYELYFPFPAMFSFDNKTFAAFIHNQRKYS